MTSLWIRQHRTDLAAAGFILLMLAITIAALSGEKTVALIVLMSAFWYLVVYDRIRGSKRVPGYYLLFIWGDVEPNLEGPFGSHGERLARAQELRREEGDEHGAYWLDVTGSGALEVGAFTGGVLDEGDGKYRFLNHYRCPQCNHHWSDVWNCLCDDDCPKCGNRHISPYASADCPDGKEVRNVAASD